MSLADKLKKKNEEREVAGKHPLITMGLSREVRDAYFRGVALAAFIDDGNVDDHERAYLRRVGLALNLPEAEVAEMLDALSSDCKSEDEQLSLLEEISSVINQPQVVKLFLAEFSLVWKSHASKQEDLPVYRVEIAKMMGVQIPDAFWKVFDSIASWQKSSANETKMLDGFDQAMMAYLFPQYARHAGITESAGSTRSRSTSTAVGVSCGSFSGFLSAMTEAVSTSEDGNHARKSSAGEYQIILRYCGDKTCSVANIIREITGMKVSEARSIALSGGRCLMTKLPYEEAIHYQDRFRAVGAAADVVKA